MDIDRILKDNNRYIIEYVLPIKRREYIPTAEYRGLEDYVKSLEAHIQSLQVYIHDLEERNRQWERIRASIPYRILRKIKKLVKIILRIKT